MKSLAAHEFRPRFCKAVDGGVMGLYVIQSDYCCNKIYSVGGFKLPKIDGHPDGQYAQDVFPEKVIRYLDLCMEELKEHGESGTHHMSYVHKDELRSMEMKLIPTKYNDLFIWIAKPKIK